MRCEGALTTQQAFINFTENDRTRRKLLVSDIRFTKNICATLGTSYDVLKGRNDNFKLNFFHRQKRFILNYKYNPLIGYFGNKNLGDFFLPAIHRQNSSLAGKKIDNKLYKEIERIMRSLLASI